VLVNWPEWALRQALGRHCGPALETAKAEALARGWSRFD
jgi:hypothetical protein